MPLIDYATALTRLSEGRLVALPTETVYGLAGRIDRDDTLRSIFTVKKRPFFDPLIVHVATRDQARELTSDWPEIYERLVERFWPGPLTLVAPKSDRVAPLITSGLDTVAIRSPAHELTRRLLTELKVPLAAPSANRFGRTSPTLAAHVISEFESRIDVLDGGACAIGLESTVVRWSGEAPDRLRVLRPGAITARDLAGFGLHVEFSTSAASPGHLPAHYQPDCPVVLVTRPPESHTPAEIERALGKGSISELRPLKLNPKPELAARELYHQLRLAATNPRAAILIPIPPDTEDWRAINDRLRRAASAVIE